MGVATSPADDGERDVTLEAGTRLGPYEVLAPLGAGGMGEVYRARDTRLERDVALKVVGRAPRRRPRRPSAVSPAEAKIAARLTHPNVCTLFDADTDGAVAYAVLELLEGETLGRPDSPAGRSPRRRRGASARTSRGASRMPTSSASSTATSSPRTSS